MSDIEVRALRRREGRRAFAIRNLFDGTQSYEDICAAIGVAIARPECDFDIGIQDREVHAKWERELRDECCRLLDFIGDPPPPTSSPEGSVCLITAARQIADSPTAEATRMVFRARLENAEWPPKNVTFLVRGGPRS